MTHPLLNPFNGIERETGERKIMVRRIKNPFNGIERDGSWVFHHVLPFC